MTDRIAIPGQGQLTDAERSAAVERAEILTDTHQATTRLLRLFQVA